MKQTQAIRVRAFGQVVVFGGKYPQDFPAATKANEQLDIIARAEAAATAGGTDQQSNDGLKRKGTATKAEFYDDLYDDLRDINRTAKAMADEILEVDEKFRMPRSPSYKSLLISARAFLKDATPLQTAFVEYGMDVDFLNDLAADIEAFDNAEDDQQDGEAGKTGATSSIEEAVRVGMTALRKLRTMMLNRYKSDPAKLAEWLTACHVERPPRKEKKKDETAGA